MDDLLVILKEYNALVEEEYHIVAYTSGLYEIENDHKCIISGDLDSVKKELIERVNRTYCKCDEEKKSIMYFTKNWCEECRAKIT